MRSSFSEDIVLHAEYQPRVHFQWIIVTIHLARLVHGCLHQRKRLIGPRFLAFFGHSTLNKLAKLDSSYILRIIVRLTFTVAFLLCIVIDHATTAWLSLCADWLISSALFARD